MKSVEFLLNEAIRALIEARTLFLSQLGCQHLVWRAVTESRPSGGDTCMHCGIVRDALPRTALATLNKETERVTRELDEYPTTVDGDGKRTVVIPSELFDRTIEALMTKPMTNPTDEQLDSLFANYRLFVQDKAPAPDLKVLRERQRATWDAVFNDSTTIT